MTQQTKEDAAPRPLLRRELVKLLSERTGLLRPSVDRMLLHLAQLAEEQLLESRVFAIPGVARFDVVVRAPRHVVTPLGTADLPQRCAVRPKVAKLLRDRVAALPAS